LKFIKIKQK